MVTRTKQLSVRQSPTFVLPSDKNTRRASSRVMTQNHLYENYDTHVIRPSRIGSIIDLDVRELDLCKGFLIESRIRGRFSQNIINVISTRLPYSDRDRGFIRYLQLQSSSRFRNLNQPSVELPTTCEPGSVMEARLTKTTA